MTVQCLSEIVKDQIVGFYQSKSYTLRDIAVAFGTSTRTINRVLVEKGLATTVPRLKGEAYAVMRFLATKDITTVDALQKVFASRPINPDDVQEFLNTCSADELTTHYYRAVHAHTMRVIPHASPVHVPRINQQRHGDLFAPAA